MELENSITIDININIEWIIREYYEYLYVYNLDVIGKSLKRHNLAKLIQEEINNMNKLISIKKLNLLKNVY